MKQIQVSAPPPPPSFEDDGDELLVRALTTKAEACHNDNFRQWIDTRRPDASQRNRIQFKFWLDARKLGDFQLCQWLDELRQGRAFTPVIRDALRLYRDLRAGQYGVLQELFPAVFDRILAEHCQPASADFSALMREIADLKTQRPAVPNGTTAPEVRPQGPKSSTPVETDEDDTGLIQTRKAIGTGKAAAENFLKSAFALTK